MYLCPGDVWDFEGNTFDRDKNVSYDPNPRDTYFLNGYRYGSHYGNGRWGGMGPNGFIFVANTIPMTINNKSNSYNCDGLYWNTRDDESFHDTHVYSNYFMKDYRCCFVGNTNENNEYSDEYECLKFSEKGIKVVPILEHFNQPYGDDDDDDYWDDEDEEVEIVESPKDDDKIVQKKWNLIQNTKEKMDNGDNIVFIANKTKAKAKDNNDNNDDDENEDEDDYGGGNKKTDINGNTESVKKYFQSLLKRNTFNYEYFYKIDENVASRLIRVNGDSNKNNKSENAFYYLIRNYAFSFHFYPKLANYLPNDYVSVYEEDINDKLSILNKYLGEKSLSKLILFEFIGGKEGCCHSKITHLIYKYGIIIHFYVIIVNVKCIHLIITQRDQLQHHLINYHLLCVFIDHLVLSVVVGKIHIAQGFTLMF